MKNIIDLLEKRGLIEQLSAEEIRKETERPIKFYIGFDPTADSLHLGNLFGIVILTWFQKYGHEPFVILGGATGRIGDPSGKSIERPFLDDQIIEENVQSIQNFFGKIFSRLQGKSPVILNNDSWFRSISFVDFLRDVGKYFRVSTMLSKESVKTRLASSDGMSFTEFSYQVLQGYDFSYLFKHYGIRLQIGGSDQWGNITAGIELNRKIVGETVYGLTFPLLTRSDGKKFGKSEGGAVWLSEKKLSFYQFYQYLVQVPDTDVITLMKRITFLDLEEIYQWEQKMKAPEYVPNSAQKKLAEEVTRFVHGEEGLQIALKVTEGAAPGSETFLNSENLAAIANDMPHLKIAKLEVIGAKLVDVFVKSGIVSSKGEATRLMKNGGAYLNNDRIEDVSFIITEKNCIDGSFILLASGKKKKLLLSLF
ncbi:MAG: tyrosine--tRNA ligase [Chlamydiota bacterium]